MEPLKVIVKLNEKDYKDFYFDFYFKAGIVKNIFILVIFAGLYLYLIDWELTTYSIILGIFVAALLFVLFTVLDFFLGNYRLLKEYKSNTLAKFDQVFSFTNSGFSKESEKSNIEFEWNDIYKVIETKKSFYILYSKSSPIMIPKRVFSSNKEIEALANIIIYNIDRSKIKSNIRR